MEDKEKVLEAMKDAGKPVRPGQVAEATGIDKKELSKIIKELKKEGKIFSPKQCFYSLAD
jgi:biotin operon repressor